MKARPSRLVQIVVLIGFVLLATANSAGYRYGASDQAFYIPAVLRHLQPALFPRDAALIDSQAKLTIVDEGLAVASRVTHLSLPTLFLGCYLATLGLLLAGAIRLAAHFYESGWTLIAFAAALTLRHAIARTGANTLEGYFHPRQLAFALGVWALAFAVERRWARVAALVLLALAIHSTTALWFAIVLATAAVFQRRLPWRTLAVAGAAAAALAAVALMSGPLAGRLVRMDAAWLDVIAAKDYLFPLQWPASAWVSNLITVPVILAVWRIRERRGRAFAGEGALVAGAMALAVVFAVWIPFDAAHVALAVQLQVGRVFWLLDFMATLYVVWLLCEAAVPGRRAWLVAVCLMVAATARGGYSLLVSFPERPLFSVDFDNADWRSAMAWARTTPPESGWLADPYHAARYGSSLRAAGQRDVLLEAVKDTAIAMYDRPIAMRVAERERALEAHSWDSVEGARALAAQYGLDYLIVDRPLPLPEAHRAGTLYIYRLR